MYLISVLLIHFSLVKLNVFGFWKYFVYWFNCLYFILSYFVTFKFNMVKYFFAFCVIFLLNVGNLSNCLLFGLKFFLNNETKFCLFGGRSTSASPLTGSRTGSTGSRFRFLLLGLFLQTLEQTATEFARIELRERFKIYLIN